MTEYTSNKDIDFAALDSGRYEHNVFYQQELMPVFNLDTANYLLKRDFKLYKVKCHKYETGKVVFFFEKTPESVAAKETQIKKFKGIE